MGLEGQRYKPEKPAPQERRDRIVDVWYCGKSVVALGMSWRGRLVWRLLWELPEWDDPGVMAQRGRLPLK